MDGPMENQNTKPNFTNPTQFVEMDLRSLGVADAIKRFPAIHGREKKLTPDDRKMLARADQVLKDPQRLEEAMRFKRCQVEEGKRKKEVAAKAKQGVEGAEISEAPPKVEAQTKAEPATPLETTELISPTEMHEESIIEPKVRSKKKTKTSKTVEGFGKIDLGEQMNQPPAFQFYPNDWLGSTQIMLMTPAEEGAYIRLLAIEWNAKDCGLPDDDKELSRLSRLNEGWFDGSGKILRKCFIKKGSRLYNQRLLKEREKQIIWREKSREGGIISGKTRKIKLLTVGRVVEPPLNHPSEEETKGGCLLVEPNANSSSSSSFSNIKHYVGGSDLQLADLLLEEILKNKPDFKKPNLQTWAKDISLILRIDKRTPDRIREVILWSQSDSFWRSTILSPGNLRKQFDRLEMAMGKTSGAKERPESRQPELEDLTGK